MSKLHEPATADSIIPFRARYTYMQSCGRKAKSCHHAGATFILPPGSTFPKGTMRRGLSLLLQQLAPWTFGPNFLGRNPCPTRPCLRRLHTRQRLGKVGFPLDMHVGGLLGGKFHVNYILCHPVGLRSQSLSPTAGSQMFLWPKMQFCVTGYIEQRPQTV